MSATRTPGADTLHRFIAEDHTFRVVCCQHRLTVAEALRRHQLSGLCAIALGRALTAAQLLATLTKGRERLTLQLVGDGPVRGILADAWSSGEVRGYVQEPVVQDWTGTGRPHVSRILGRQGRVSVFRDLGLKDIYHGESSFVQGEVDEDVEGYLRQSEQIPSALGCEVLLDESGHVIQAVGILVQGMPGTREQPEDPIRQAQHRLRTGVLRRLLTQGVSDAAQLAVELVGPQALLSLGQTALRFHCPCNLERMTQAVATLGVAELESLLAERGQAEVACHFCATVHTLEATALSALIARLKAQPPG